MQLIEKIKPSGINTDIHPSAVEQGNQGNRRLINPVIDALNKHYFTSEDSDGERTQNVMGNALKANSLPAGTNVCIGSYEDRLNNELIFWNYNSNGNHGVYAYSPETDTIRTLIVNSQLNFQNDRKYLVTGAGSVGSLIYWSDGYNPQRVINRTRDYTYLTFDIADITVYKKPPSIRVTAGQPALYDTDPTESKHAQYDRAVDTSIKVNSISDNSYQFSLRYQYLDNEYSVIAQYTDLSQAEWEPDAFNNTRTKIPIQIKGVNAAQNFLKAIELLVRKNNEDQWYIFETIRAITGSDITTQFTGMDNVIPVDQVATAKLFESAPDTSKALVLHRNRLFVSADSEGFDVGTEPTLAISEVAYTNIGNKILASGQTVLATYGSKTFTLTTSAVYAVGEMVEVFRSGFIPSPLLMRGKVQASSGTSVTISIAWVGSTYGASFSSSGLNNIVIKQIALRYNISTGALEQNGDWSQSYWKTNGIFYLGLAVFDEFHKCMGIVSKTKYTASSGIKPSNLPNKDVLSCAKDILLNVNIGGNFSTTPKAKYYSLCVSEDQLYLTYQQILAKVMYYVGEYTTGATLGVNQYLYQNRVYVSNPTRGFSSIHLVMPLNLSFAVDDSFYVRILAMPGVTNWSAKISKVEKTIDSEIIQVDLMGITDSQWLNLKDGGAKVVESLENGSTIENPFPTLAVEIFKQREVKTNSFFEISKRYGIDNSGILEKTSFSRLQGFNYRPSSNLNPTYQKDNAIYMVYSEPRYIQYNTGGKASWTFKKPDLQLLNVELPSPTIGISSNIKVPTLTPGQQAAANPKVLRERIVTPDYSKIADNRGKTITELEDKKSLKRKTTIRFSNKYVQDTNINGLSNFDTADQYPLDPNRGAIVKMVSLGSRILAIHERATSVVYTEEAMVRNADGSEQLIASAKAIGYDQELAGGFGSYHAESVQAISNMVFAFDVHKGCIWRYTQEGQFPISDYGMATKFRDLARTILDTKDTTKVVAGIDPFHNEYIITINGETYAFNYVANKWTTRYSFVPEMYGTIGKQMVTFKNGALWLHNASATHNNFYGVQYESFIKIAVNPHPSRVKVAHAIQLAQESVSSDIDFKQIEVTTEDGQYSYTKADEFEHKEGVWYAPVLKDVNTQSDTIPGLLALRQGDDMRSKVLFLQINDDSTERNSLQLANFVYATSEYSE